MQKVITPKNINFVKSNKVKICKVEKNGCIVSISDLTLENGWSKDTATKLNKFGGDIFVFGELSGANPFGLNANDYFILPKNIVCNDLGAVKTFITLRIGYDGVNTYLYAIYNDAYFITAESNLPIMPTYKIISG